MNNSFDQAATDKSLVSKIFGVLFETRTYANIGYLLLAMPLGVGYFCWLVTAFALGVGLWIVLMGIPILFFTILTVYWMTGFERWLAINMLGEDVPPLRRDAVQGEGFVAWAQGVFTTSATWKGLVFLFAKFPLGIVSFVIAITTLSFSAAFLLAPLTLLYEGGINIGPWFADTLWETLLCVPVGLVGLFLSLHLLNALAFVWRKFSAVMLGQGLPGDIDKIVAAPVV